MIDDKIKKAFAAEVKESKLPTDIWQGVFTKIAVQRKFKKTPLGWARSQLVVSILIVLFLISLGGGITRAILKHTPRPDTVLKFEANLSENEVSIKGEAPLPDGAKIRIMAHRVIVYEENKQRKNGNVLIALGDAEVLDEQFIAIFILDDSEWYNRKMARDAELDSHQTINITDNIKITAVYIPEELQPSLDDEAKPKSFTTSKKRSSEEGQNKPQELPRFGQVIINYPFKI